MTDNIIAFSATEVGYNHIKVNKICEDASDYYDDGKIHISVVADGHGSDNYPRTQYGSQFAVNSAIQCIIDFVNTADSADVLSDETHNYSMMYQLAKSILKVWYQQVEEDWEKRPFTEEELVLVSDKYKNKYLSTDLQTRNIQKAYGCTLIAFVITTEYSFGMQIGDGKCVMVDENGQFSEPIPWDENCQLNVTTSICDNDAIDEFRFFVTNMTPTAIFLGTDGIDDSYANMEELYALYRSILKIFIEHGNIIGKSEIKEYLPILTKKGSGDDVSLGLILNCELANKNKDILDSQNDIFQLNTKMKQAVHKKERIIEKKKALTNKMKKLIDSGKMFSEEYQNTEMQFHNLVSAEMKMKESITEIQKELQEKQNNIKNVYAKQNEPENTITEKIEIKEEKNNLFGEEDA